MLSSRSLAVQGVGFGTAQMAVHGLTLVGLNLDVAYRLVSAAATGRSWRVQRSDTGAPRAYAAQAAGRAWAAQSVARAFAAKAIGRTWEAR